MFAVVRTGGKQYRVAANDIIAVEKLDGEPGAVVELTDVLMVGNETSQTTGAPVVAGATVAAEVMRQTRAKKVVIFKKKRRKDYRRTLGHKQHLTLLRITEILTDGKKPEKRAAAKPAAKADDKADEGAKKEPKAAKPKAQAATKPAAKSAAKKPAAKKPAAKKSKE
jgi:large subunit ribosomal protein L21